MRTKKIRFNPFDPESVSQAILQLEREKRSMEIKLELFCQRLSEYGVEIARKRVLTLGAVFTGELLESLHTEQKGLGFYVIKTDSEHCAFVEFGTGQMGEEMPYPYPFPQDVTWTYNDYTREGSKIFQIAEGEYGWFYPALDGTWKFTQGMESRPFMYETALELRTVVNKVAKEIFG